MDANVQPDTPAAVSGRRPVILFVDDEANILSAMRRLFRSADYEVATAGSGREALAYLEQHPVDMVVSDMRMPEQSGAELLCIVKERWPDTLRIILTGYADMTDTMRAINRGEIYRYLLKPWQDDEFVAVVRDALVVKSLRDEKARLEQLVRQQNRELEQKVKERTAELQKAMGLLSNAHDSLKKSFVTSIKVFTSLIEMRGGSIGGHSRRVADLAKQLARHMGLSDADAQEIMVAGLLHDIGKLGLPDKLIQTPYVLLSPTERAEYEKHTVNGQAALMALEQLQKAALLIRHHHERFDGKGYPDGLAMEQIPMGARILALANDFDSLQSGTLEEHALSRDDAYKSIIAHAGKRYDPAVVEAFTTLLGNTLAEPIRVEMAMRSSELKPGMVLARDLSTQAGMLLLAKDYPLDERLIEQIYSFERSARQPLPIYIYKPEEPAPQ
ncbi:response regulator [Chitinimonas viridis]|uniref:Response regulator n=1 Tax=Chitinimonas viridis TaxID=664880 RepID=A0ABT8B2Q5_9NEIS|nr:HD domain-containing phosphohydrolase [Chitinimonas viridis]MDN3576532.1 response regulator [Chitinimonas viridis]